MNKKRLLKLADLLDTVPAERFDYSDWRVNGDGVDDDEYLAKQANMRLTNPKCNSQACALGWATEIRSFGLTFTAVEGEYSVFRDVIHKDSGKMNFDAAALVFGMTEQEAEYLFSPAGDEPEHDPKFVAKKIRAFVEKYS